MNALQLRKRQTVFSDLVPCYVSLMSLSWPRFLTCVYFLEWFLYIDFPLPQGVRIILPNLVS